MPNLVKRTDTLPSISSSTPTHESQVDGVAGEALEAGDVCYLVNGTFKKASTTSAAASRARGAVATSVRKGFPCTLYRTAVFGYTDESGANAAVYGANYYVSSVPGLLSDTAPTGNGINALPVAFGREDGNVHFICN